MADLSLAAGVVIPRKSLQAAIDAERFRMGVERLGGDGDEALAEVSRRCRESIHLTSADVYRDYLSELGAVFGLEAPPITRGRLGRSKHLPRP